MHARVRSPKDLGLLVRRVRQQHGQTQEQLARLLGVTPRYLSELETGRPKRADERFYAILARLGIQMVAQTDD